MCHINPFTILLSGQINKVNNLDLAENRADVTFPLIDDDHQQLEKPLSPSHNQQDVRNSYNHDSTKCEC